MTILHAERPAGQATTAEAARRYGVTVATVRAWCRRRLLDATKRAGRWVIRLSATAARPVASAAPAAVRAPGWFTAGAPSSTLSAIARGRLALRGY